MNLDKIYTVKSNATRDMKKAIAKGELPAGAEVVVVPSGYQIVLPSAVEPPKTSMWSEDRTLPVATDKPKPAAEWVFTKKATPQVEALPGVTPLGFGKPLTALKVKPEVLTHMEVWTPPAKPAPDAKKDFGLALTVALAASNVWTEKGLKLSDRAEVWVPFESVHDSRLPHGLSKGQMPASTGNARKRGLIEVEWSDMVGLGKPRKLAVRLTAAGLAAHKGQETV